MSGFSCFIRAPLTKGAWFSNSEKRTRQQMGKIRKAWAVMGREGYGDIPLIIIGFFDTCIRMAFFSKAAPKFFHDSEDG